MLHDLFRWETMEAIFEMAFIWPFVYLAFRFLRGTRGAGVLKGFLVMMAGIFLLTFLGEKTGSFDRLLFMYKGFFGLLAILLIVVFQPELRQAAIRIGQASLPGATHAGHVQVSEAVGEAAAFLSRRRFGALIALERTVKLGGLIEGGQLLDAKLSARLLQSIFWPNSPLHDLGVIVRDQRVLAAGVQFPLAEEGLLPLRYGSRHRAAAGLSMESDCMVVVISEETGAISIVQHGAIERDIAPEAIQGRLAERLATPTEATSLQAEGGNSTAAEQRETLPAPHAGGTTPDP